MQETFEEALWPRHLEYRNSVLATVGSKGKVHILDAEQPPAKILADALPIVDAWAVKVAARGDHKKSDDKSLFVARAMGALEAATSADVRTKRKIVPRATL